MDFGSVLLIAVSLAFAWSMGAHYTGATMGMSYASRSIRMWPALILMGIFALLGATFASHSVELNVGQNIVNSAQVTLAAAIIIVATAFFLTTVLTYLKIPSSTIQILVFAVVGVALAYNIPVRWPLIGSFLVTWALAPLAACGLGYVLTFVIDRISGKGVVAHNEGQITSVGQRSVAGTLAALSKILVIFGIVASFTMGANDVSNATGVFVMTHLFGVAIAGLVGGLGLAFGALTWGRPLLKRVAFDVVKLDLATASAAQFAQAIVVFVPVLFFGFFTSMNQALVGAMAGAGLARGRQTIQWPTIYGILEGWAAGPISSLTLGFILAKLLLLL